jgi:hypothetical protein
MKGLSHTATIGSIRAKVDRSVGYSLTTPELSSSEKVALMDLQDQVVEIIIRPLDEPDAVVVPVKETINRKSQASRIRSVIFVLWSTKRERGFDVPADFEHYYQQITEWLIETVKKKLEELE